MVKKDICSFFVCVLEKLIPMPSKGNRSLLPFICATKIMKANVRVDSDADYLVYQAGSIIEKLSLLTLLGTYFDLLFGTNLLLDYDLFLQNKSALLIAWGKPMGPISLFIAWLFYFRSRLATETTSCQSPIFFDQKFIESRGEREGRQILLLIAVLALVLIPLVISVSLVSEGSALDVIWIRSNISVAIIMQFIFAISIGPAISVGLSAALFLSKLNKV